MSSIDERVVEAKFDNRQFQEGVKGTLSSLESLKKGLQLPSGAAGLGGLAGATGKVTNGLNVMRIAAITAISTIAHQATLAGEQLVKSFTVGPLIDGFHEYETQLTSVQTILSNTQWEHTGMSDVNNALNQLNHYADKTIYNFSEMARNVGTFTAAGVKLDVSVNAIKGIANLAAVSGSNSQQASTAMYQLSQALASGTVKLMDWNSVVNAGMGGKVFQDALIQTAKVHNVNVNKMIKSEGSFRNTLQKGWLTSKILTETLNKFTGEQSRAQLKRQGYTEKEITQIMKLGKTATDAATKIKTGTQLVSTLKEAAGSGWTQTWQLIIGNFTQAKKMWTDVYNVLGGAINHMSNARNKLLKDWAAIGGRQSMLDGIKFAFQALIAVVKPLRDAFRDIFPKKDQFQLLAMTDAFRDFMAKLIIGPQTADKLRRVFAGLFAVLDIGWQLIKAGIHFFGQLIGTVGHASGGVLDFAATIGDALVSLDKAIKSGHGFTKFFNTLYKAISPVITTLGITRIKLLDLGIGVAAFFKGITQTAPKILNAITTAIHSFFSKLSGTLQFDKLLQLINAGLFAGLLLMIRKFINHLKKKSDEPSPLQRFVDKITEPFHELTNTLKEMQKALQAATILEIAIAVGILTASVVALSMIDTVKLAKALGAITIMFAQLMGALWLFNKVGGAEGLGKTAAGLILLAIALRILTSSVVALSKLSWQELAKGLVGVTVLLGALILTSKGMETGTKGMIRSSAGLLILAAAIKVLASAVTDISKLSWSEILRGLTGVGALLVGLTLFTKFSAANKGGLAQGAGLLLLGAAVKVLASAMQDFGKMSWGNIAKGLVTVTAILAAFAIFSHTVGNPVKLLAAGAALVAVGVAMNALAASMLIFGKLSWGEVAKGLISMAGALTLIVLALNSMPITSVLSAAALVAVSVALTAIAASMRLMAGMSWNEVAKGLVTLAGALTIISIAMDAMVFALPGAAALLVVAGALAILVPELALIGAMSWGDILKGLVGLAGAFLVFGGAAILLSESLPVMFGLAGAIALLGLGLAAVGGAVYLFATGLQILSIAGAGAAASIKLIVGSIVSLLPTIAKAIADTIVALAKGLAEAVPQLIKTTIALMDGILTVIHVEGPKIVRTFLQLIEDLLSLAIQHLPTLSKKFVTLMLGIMDAIQNNSGKIIRKFTTMVVGILNEMAKGAPKVVTAAVNWIIAILNGIDANLHRVIQKGTDIVIHLIQGLGQATTQIANATMQTVLQIIYGIDDAIKFWGPQIHAAGVQLAVDIIEGVTIGIAKSPWDIGWKLGKDLIGAAKAAVGSKSPAKEFIKLGHFIDQGLAKGLVGGREAVAAAWGNLHDLLRTALDNAKQDIQDYQGKLKDAKDAHNPAKIRKFTAALAEAHREFNLAAGALDQVNNHMKRQHDHLIRLSKRYDEYTAKIQKANQALADAKQLRDDYKTSVTDQYNVLPDIAGDTNLTDYETNLKKSVVDTQSLADVMAQLRKMGLDDATYKEIISKGTEALPFAEQILAGGPAAIKELKELDKKLADEAKALGSNASTALYQAGVDSAQGVVDGLIKKRDAIAREMRHIAHTLVVELKKELKIKSPSQVLDDLGQLTGKGLARGLKKSIPHVQRATHSLGKNTVESMKQSIREMNELLAVESNLNPTITPVLDLSSVRKQAAGMGDILAKKLATDAAYAQAMNASSGYEANLVDTAGGDIPESAPGGITFIQNNNSPKALSTADIYRNTNNQLSRVKGALNPSAA